ncbi:MULTISPECIES: salmochelin biosynthesis C-glycosyltransferase IroB [Klebsiella]|jgi:UDP:flavonoid glycosyltransferase YjiC (YdhE family)|uniref:IroB n=1 Tax=Klebsiella aerogenes (strain ATCC 13048 / DSM 30053 / CCUG 1429 / JCM 1235 / KCTC 2190 / NBRC 13534 / NCIMB 10102 / NCTC 10006 / CDC 819-56) TaxID=1028307 RepID=A0A0H3FJL3_KLEAK|nr:salmochelin biosynthesis C-glycosyltransferase IroB [Klebsiella aerogenes]AEG95589.1 IroB [Klebsiella aerogenes KCTC 2190]AWD03113.1 glycosyl transferase [Klebsiella aerogenes]EIV3801564.1 salmochelin biosynthesis C-glycosyltransferase IroB [Klebsiella aerogenes]EIV5419439.1 salmochelin biosynthesis C-glycosyltransferase IroB [Klebsiella aerogenes]EIV6643782.1 salmochelin biosynthesis C-glycosyltransferase IroB [Klebsiella aerogenes]
MRILFVGPPLYGLLYPVLSLAQAFRVNGHEVLIASSGKFAQKAAEAGLVVFDAAPGFDSEADYRRREAQRKESNIGTKMGNFSFFSEEMADQLVEFAGHWRPDLIVYPPLGVVGPLIAAKYDIPVVMQTVGFGHTPWHIKGVTRSLADAYRRHGVEAPPQDMAWIDVTPPSMSILQNDGEPIIPMQYVPYNGGAVWEEWWERTPDRKRLLVSLGTVKPMVDGLDLISWVMDSASEVDAEIILHLSANARSDLRALPSNVRLVDWIPMGAFLNGADGFIHHGGAGNTLTALHAGIPQIVFGQGADRPVNARAVVDRGCGIIPGDGGLSSSMINAFLDDRALRTASEEVAAEMAAQACPTEVAKELAAMAQKG